MKSTNKVAQPKRRVVSAGELLHRSFIAAMRHRWHYRGYATRDAAITGLRGRCPGFPAARYQRAFDKASALYARTTEVVDRHYARSLKQAQRWTAGWPRDMIDKLQRLAPGFRISTYRAAIGWVCYWHYWR